MILFFVVVQLFEIYPRVFVIIRYHIGNFIIRSCFITSINNTNFFFVLYHIILFSYLIFNVKKMKLCGLIINIIYIFPKIETL